MKQNLLNKLWLRVCMIVAIMTTALTGTVWADTTYKLQQVTSVEEGGLYVFEQGGHVMNNTFSSSALQTTTSYSTTGLTGTETYVWTLEAATDGFKMRNVSWEGQMLYLTNSSSTGVNQNNNASVWAFNFQDDNTVLIQNKSNADRFLGYTSTTSYAYKAYATSNLTSSSYPHAIKVYQLVEETGGGDTPPTPTTYTVTYDANGGTGSMTDSNSPYNSGATVTVLGNTFTYDGYTFSKWNTAADGSGTDYAEGATFTISANTTLYAQWTANGGSSSDDGTLTFDLTSNPGGWPTASSSTLEDYTYTLGGVDYTFALKNIKCNSGYLMIYSVGVLGLPAIDGYKLTKVVASNSSGCSTSTKVGISSSDSSEEYVTGGEQQQWSTTSSTYTYTLTGTSANTMYYMYVTNKNAQVTQLKLTYEADGSAPAPSFTISNNNEIAYDATSGSFDFTVNNPADGGVTTVSEDVDWISDAAVSGNSVTFTTTANEAAASRQGVITLAYTYGTETITKDVTVTQAGNPDVVSTIAQVRAQGSGSVVTKGVVTSCVGTTAYIQDNTAAICVYGEALTVGDEVKVEGTLSTYKGLLEITSPNVTVLSSNNTVTPEVMTIADINASTNQGWLVKIENAVVLAIDGQNVTLAQGSNNVVVRFNSTSDITFAVNDQIESITGNIGCFNTVQIANPRDVVVATNLVPSIELGDNVINAYAQGTDGVIIVDYKNITTVVAKVFFCDADGNAATYDWVTASINSNNNLEYIIDANASTDARTAYMKVYAPDDNGDDVYSELITINQAGYVAPVSEFATLPFSFDGGKADIETTAGLTQEGLDSDYGSSPKLKFNGTGDYVVLAFDERPGKLTFDVKGNPSSGVWAGTFTVQTSEDGTTYTDLAAYTDLTSTMQSEEFNNLGENVRYIKWIYTEKVSGNVALGNIALATYTEPVVAASITVDPATVDATAAETTGALELTYADFTVSGANDFDVQFYDGEGNELQDAPAWIDAEVEANGEGYVVSYVIEANDGEARTTYFKVHAQDNENKVVYSNLVTVSQAAYVAPATGDQYALFTGSLEEGDYIIYYDGYAMNTDVESGRLMYAEVTPESDVITTSNAAIVWHISKSGDYWTLYNAEADAYAAGTGVKNKAQMLADGTDDMALWTVSGTDTYEFVNKANAAASVNANLRKNGTYGFACYATTTGGALSLYKKVPATGVQTITVTDAGYATMVAAADLEIPTGVEVYAVQVNGNYAHLESVTTGVPAGEAVVVKADAGDYNFAYAASSVPAITGNNLVAATTDVTADGTQYVLANGASGIGFYQATPGSTIPAGKAYLVVTAAGVKPFYGFEDDATGIEMVNGQSSMVNDPIFNLAGQRLQKMQRGINIIGGKKVLK